MRYETVQRWIKGLLPTGIGAALLLHEAFDSRPEANPAVILAGLACLGVASGLTTRDFLKPLVDAMQHQQDRPPDARPSKDPPEGGHG